MKVLKLALSLVAGLLSIGAAAPLFAAAHPSSVTASPVAGDQGAKEKALGPDASGRVFRSASADGLGYEFFVPKSYDPAVGANLTFILHGSNLDRRWGFANHSAGKFREGDVVVCPDGTTSNGRGGFNFLQSEKDLTRLHALQDEIRGALKIRSTFLYGHSQGSFFSFLYAGAYPEDVQGVVGQASGVWIGTRGGKKHHHQAVALMHGTEDPVVPYRQSVGGYDFYADMDYPLLHLRSLDGWNHWPSQTQTEQQLDPAAAFQVCSRALEFEGLDGKCRKAATKAVAEEGLRESRKEVQLVRRDFRGEARLEF